MRSSTRIATPSALTRLVVLAGLASILIGCASTKVSAEPPAGTDLSGDWALNKSLSADTQGAIAHATAQAFSMPRNVDAGGGVRGGSGKGGGGRRGGNRGSSNAAGMPQPRFQIGDIVAELSPSTERLKIVQNATSLRVSHDSTWDYNHTFGSEAEISIYGIDAEQITGWQEHEYVVETTTDSGVTVLERFSIVPDTDQLQITLHIDSKRLPDPIIVARFYDRSEVTLSTS